jgi:putative ABC transport system ATP-binding protein
MSGASVELVDVAKRYLTPAGPVSALDGIDLRIGPGESLAIVGPSGGGKSTLLGLIAGLDVPSTGRVWIDDREISSMHDDERAGVRRHDMGLVFQSHNLLPYLTATENVSVQLSLRDGDGGHARSTQVLMGSGLGEELDRLPDQLSGGQRQRVAIARALVHRPRLIVADEPTGSLDPENARAVLELLLAAQRGTGATLILVTHDGSIAARLPRAVTLRDGRLTPGIAPATSRRS